MKKIERALISVFDKRGIVDFARALNAMGVEILSTGGTARLLGKEGIEVREVSEITGFPEVLDGRVKTLHPRIHAGILAVRDNPDHQAQLDEHNIGHIDLICVNLYPFVETTRKAGATFGDIVENIDIGGPSMLRAGSKNFRDVAVVTDPDDYSAVINELEETDGILSPQRLFSLAQKSFVHTGQYDGAIAEYLSQVDWKDEGPSLPENTLFPPKLFMDFERVAQLRYGENPHQSAAFYRWGSDPVHGLAAAGQLQGKELSYNNLVDLQAAWALILEFEDPACAIIKHTNPCGAALGSDLRDAYLKALDANPVSAFGSIIAVNRPLDGETAEEMAKLFVEAIIAPRIEDEAKEVFAAKKNLRVLELKDDTDPAGTASLEIRRVLGGILVQDTDASRELEGPAVKVATPREPSEAEWRDLRFAWKVARHVKSNAIVLAANGRTAGVGAGQMSRVDSVKISVEKARPSAKGTVMASDAFFPFRDGLDAGAEAGIRAVIQPGGSRRDEEVIEAAAEHDIAMVFTGTRHFKH